MKKSLLFLLCALCTLSVFNSCSEDDLSSDAKIEAFTFADSLVTVQPVIDGTSIKFVVSDKIKKEELAKLVPTITISANATMTPATGVAQDFSKPVLYKVTSQDGATTTEYTVTSARSTLYTFEEWEAGVEEQEPENTFYEVANGWSSSNTGAHFLKAFQLTDRYPVTQSTEAHSGKSSARLETLDTKGMDMGFVKVPRVTSGSLFLGDFITDIMNTLNSTKFGNEYHAKPISLKGYYKYIPGKTFYRCESAATCDVTTVDAKTVDQCAINAVLYEVNSYDNEDDYLTGVNINDPAKLTATARLEDGSAKSEWTAFEVEFKYLKSYDPSKKYRFAIICSSSSDGNNFNGAPGSVLYVDDFEVIAE